MTIVAWFLYKLCCTALSNAITNMLKDGIGERKKMTLESFWGGGTLQTVKKHAMHKLVMPCLVLPWGRLLEEKGQQSPGKMVPSMLVWEEDFLSDAGMRRISMSRGLVYQL